MKLWKWTYWILTKTDIIVNLCRNSKFYFTLKKASHILCGSFSYQKLKWIDKNTISRISCFPKTASSKTTILAENEGILWVKGYDALLFPWNLPFHQSSLFLNHVVAPNPTLLVVTNLTVTLDCYGYYTVLLLTKTIK